MEWLQSNWIWIALGVGFIAFHVFGHGGHGNAHGSHSRRDRRDEDRTNDVPAAPTAEHTHADGSAPRADTPNAQALRNAPAHAGSDASPTSTDGKRHRHGC
jgi:hypothetical protein